METDVMDDLFYDSAEGMAEMGYADDFDDFDDGYDEFDEFDSLDEFDDFYNEYDASDDFDDFEDAYDSFDSFYDAYDDFDGFEEDYDAFDDFENEYDALDYLVADALASYDTDEFLKKLKSIGRKVFSTAKKVGKGIGKVARVAAPILSKIPLPQAQAIARIANIAGKLLADGADELEALDTFVDFAEYEGDFDAAAPVIAGLAIKKALPDASRLPKRQRLKLVKNVKKSTKMLARRQGVKTTKAMPTVVNVAKRASKKTGQPITKTIPKATAKVAKSPTIARRLASKVNKVAKTKKMMKKGMKYPGGMAYPYGRKKHYNVRGPLNLTLRCR